MRNVGGDEDIPLKVIDFHVEYLQDDTALNCDGEEKDESTENGEVVSADIEESITLTYGKGKKNSAVVCDVDNDGLISDDDLHLNSELVMHIEVYLDYGDADIEGEVNCVMDSQYAAKISDNMLKSDDARSFDGCAVDLVEEAEVSKVKEDGSNSQDGFKTGDDWEFDFSEHDNSDENALSDDDGNDRADEGEHPILISNGDKMAMEHCEVKPKMQTFVLTFRRKSQYSNGQLICQAESMERVY